MTAAWRTRSTLARSTTNAARWDALAGPKTSVGPRNVLCLRLQEESAKKTKRKGKRKRGAENRIKEVNKEEKNRADAEPGSHSGLEPTFPTTAAVGVRSLETKHKPSSVAVVPPERAELPDTVRRAK